MKRDFISGIDIPAEQPNLYDRILTPAAIGFVAHLHRKYEQRRRACMAARVERQKRLNAGESFGFLPSDPHNVPGNPCTMFFAKAL